MSTLTIRLPDDTHLRLRKLAKHRAISVNKLIEELATTSIAEFYRLLRNPAVLKHPLPAGEAVGVIQTYRRHPRWRLIGFPTESRPLHDALWKKARAKDFAFCKLYDTRSALTMTALGVTEFAMVNVKDFEGLGFRKVWNPVPNK